MDYNEGMSTISVIDIQRDPAGFLSRIEAGESMVVVRDDRAVAEIRPVKPVVAGEPRPIGLCRGEFVVPADFDAPLPDEVIEGFEGR